MSVSLTTVSENATSFHHRCGCSEYILLCHPVVVDTILGSTLLGIITAPIQNMSYKDVGWGALLTAILAGGATALGSTIVGGAIAISVFGIGTMFMFVLMAIVPGVIGIVSGLLALVFRSAVIPVLAILAPLAF